MAKCIMHRQYLESNPINQALENPRPVCIRNGESKSNETKPTVLDTRQE